MPYGFVIDQRKCIGCHACTVACKAENDVPVGSFRTWVKYVDKGSYPEVKRHFTVLRCNHCDEAPCVEICPVNSLAKRDDGIVDLDRTTCIGCRSCMQACPYDALYLNEHTGTAEKCHYCAHKTEVGLQPACVTVCPEQAIIAGDTDDENEPITRLIAEQQTSQRKLEKGTKPRVWYVDALPEAIEPSATQQPKTWLWSDRARQAAPVPAGMEAPDDLVTSLNASHKKAWGWHIWLYLWTKNVAAGAMIVAPLLAMLDVTPTLSTIRDVVPEMVSLVFLGITGFLLIHDLGRPERFWRILLTPNPRSWLVKGTWIISIFGLLATVSLALRFLGDHPTSDTLRWVAWPFAFMASGYTAFLFHQCQGRDLWLGKDLFAHLLMQATLCGLLLAGLMEPSGPTVFIATVVFALINAGWLVLWHDKGGLNEDGHRAEAILHAAGGHKKAALWLLATAGLAGVAAAGVTLAAWPAAITGAVGMLVWEKAWIAAGQEVPNS